MNAPSYFRISLTASDEMVARALPAVRLARWALAGAESDVTTSITRPVLIG